MALLSAWLDTEKNSRPAVAHPVGPREPFDEAASWNKKT